MSFFSFSGSFSGYPFSLSLKTLEYWPCLSKPWAIWRMVLFCFSSKGTIYSFMILFCLSSKYKLPQRHVCCSVVPQNHVTLSYGFFLSLLKVSIGRPMVLFCLSSESMLNEPWFCSVSFQNLYATSMALFCLSSKILYRPCHGSVLSLLKYFVRPSYGFVLSLLKILQRHHSCWDWS